jgi:uncharacterized membrane protein
MIKNIFIGTLYFIVLTIGALLAGALIEFLVTLFKWLEVLFSEGSVVVANIAAQIQKEKMAASNFSSELFTKALWGWALCIFAYGYKIFSGRWPHEH